MKVYLIGIGADGRNTLTIQAAKAMKEAEVFIGAKRMLESVDTAGKPVFEEYKPQEIAAYINAHCEYQTAAVLLSGDISFYSGAKRLGEVLEGHEIVRLPGISSYSYMCAKLGIAMEDTEFVTFHKDKSSPFSRTSIACRVRDSKYVFTLLGGPEDIDNIIAQLECYMLYGCTVYIGSRLGYDDECIINAVIAEARQVNMLDYSAVNTPAVMVIENPSPKHLLGKHLSDDEFIRGKTPMTKAEVRALSIAKLNLDRDSILYDIGAGTGSISVEAALTSHDVWVYAFEKSDEAFGLINENRRKFGCDNIWQMKADAPYCLDVPPVPTHAFIGGSGGNMREIIEALTARNPEIRIVINTIAMNTTAEVMQIIRDMDFEYEIICINVARSKELAGYDMMIGQNPVYIFTLTKKKAEPENES